MPRPIHVVFAGGGSTGYLHPGLAVAAYLKQHLPQALITFAGTGKAFERHSVRANGFQYVAMPSQPVSLSAAAMAAVSILGMLRSCRNGAILRRTNS